MIALHMLWLGIPKPALQSMIETIQEMDHHVRTAFDQYGYDPFSLPAQGVLQGNGTGPAGWFAISSVILSNMKAAWFSYREWTLIHKQALVIVSFAYVDDNDLVHANNSPGVLNADLINEAQTMVSRWHGLVWATGGDLAPEKNILYLVALHWKNSRWQDCTVDDDPGDIWLPSSLVPIERCKVTKPAEALGILSRPDGKMHTKVQHL